MKLLLIDGNSIMNRGYFALPKELTNSRGVHTNALLGFLNIFYKIYDEEKPTHVAVAFDVHEPTFRHKMFAEYKGKLETAGVHDYLDENGVGTVCHYPIAPHKQECYAKEAWNIPQLSLPITEKIADEELSLPIGPAITIEEVETVVKLLNDFK